MPFSAGLQGRFFQFGVMYESQSSPEASPTGFLNLGQSLKNPVAKGVIASPNVWLRFYDQHLPYPPDSLITCGFIFQDLYPLRTLRIQICSSRLIFAAYYISSLLL
jgi:hypothetical protein